MDEDDPFRIKCLKSLTLCTLSSWVSSSDEYTVKLVPPLNHYNNTEVYEFLRACVLRACTNFHTMAITHFSIRDDIGFCEAI